MKEELLKLLIESIDLKKLAKGIVNDVVKDALDKVVADSNNTIDDTLMPILWPLLAKEVNELIEKELDLTKIFKMDEVK